MHDIAHNLLNKLHHERRIENIRNKHRDEATFAQVIVLSLFLDFDHFAPHSEHNNAVTCCAIRR